MLEKSLAFSSKSGFSFKIFRFKKSFICVSNFSNWVILITKVSIIKDLRPCFFFFFCFAVSLSSLTSLQSSV